MEKGAVNVAGEWTGGLQKPNGLKRQPRAGHHRCHGESGRETFKMKLVIEPSVWRENGDPQGPPMQPEPGRLPTDDWVYRMRYADDRIRVDRRPALPGAEPATYRTKGASWEHGNLDRSAGPAKSSKLPRPAMSPAGGRASVVVRARESRAHGEGRQ